MAGSPSIRFGILKARDLVELYFGARMVIDQRYAQQTVNNHATPLAQQILTANPARIAYELFLACAGGGDGSIYLWPNADLTAANSLRINVLGDSTVVINRDWLRYGDSLTRELWAGSTGNQFFVSTVEYLLTPLPVDNLP